MNSNKGGQSNVTPGRETILKRQRVSWDPAISLRLEDSGTELLKSGFKAL